MFDQATLDSAWGGASATPKQAQPAAKKGPGGVAGFLVNNLPGIASGVGAVGGSFLTPGAGTVAGGAAGGALGEFLKRKLTGQKEDIGQIATQGVEGGVLSSLGSAAKGITNGAKALTKLGTGTVEKEAASTAEKKASGSFLKNLTTQGQAAQGRVSGISAGSKVAGNELVPQDTERMLGTLKNEGIKTGNANNELRDLVDKQGQYGKQIADHFDTNNAPLHPEDTKVIANNYLSGLKTTDPGVLNEAEILAQDLQKNVKDTKSLWEFRKSLDSRIPDAKLAAGDNVLSNKLTAIKNMRQYIADELGNVPGMKNYHDLAEIKPFVSAEAKRLNNPGGGIVGRVLSSGPVQKTENLAGKGTEKLAQKLGSEESTIAPKTSQEFAKTAQAEPKNILDKVLTKKGIPVKYESDTLTGHGVSEGKNVTLTNPKVADIEQELNRLKGEGYSVNQRLGATPGSTIALSERRVTPDFTPLQSSPKLSAVELSGKKTSIPLQQEGSVERGIIHTPDEYSHEIPDDVLQSASDATKITPQAVDTMKPNFLQKLVGAAANPVANPGQTARAIVKQDIPRLPGAISQTATSQTQTQSNAPTPDLSNSLLQTSANSPTPSNNPYDPSNAEANVQAILQQGGTDKDVAAYLANVKAYGALNPSQGTGVSKPSAQQQSLASSALDSIQKLGDMIQQNSDVVSKDATPGQGLPIVGGLVSRAAGTSDYHTQIGNVAQAILHLQTGAAFSAEEKQAVQANLPRLGDTPEEIKNKLSTLSGFLSPFLGNTQ